LAGAAANRFKFSVDLWRLLGASVFKILEKECWSQNGKSYERETVVYDDDVEVSKVLELKDHGFWMSRTPVSETRNGPR
jgi:hypothetical protein